MTSAGILVLWGLCSSSVLPLVLLRFPATRRTPWSAVLLWQSLALSGVMAFVGAGFVAVVSLSGSGRPVSSAGVVRFVVLAGLVVAALGLLIRLGLSGHKVGTSLRSTRARQRQLVDLVGESFLGAQVLSSSVASAQCIPSVGQSRIVLTNALIESLDAAELEAVLAHERAHLNARHDLVVEAFAVLDRAIPLALAGGRAHREVTLLVEILADFSALRERGATALVAALTKMSQPQKVGELEVTSDEVEAAARLALIEARRPLMASDGGRRDATQRGDLGRRWGWQSRLLLGAACVCLAIPAVLVGGWVAS